MSTIFTVNYFFYLLGCLCIGVLCGTLINGIKASIIALCLSVLLGIILLILHAI